MNKLQALREAKGLSREQLAVAARASFAYIIRLEDGSRSNPSVLIAQRIAAALDTEVSALWPVNDNESAAADVRPTA